MADDIEPLGPGLPEPAESEAEGSELAIAADVLRIRQEIELKALAEEGIDDVIRQPLNWLNTNLAWIAGILFFCLISLRIAVAANFDVTSISAVTQTVNVQSIALQMIPVALPLVLFYFTQVAAFRLCESRSGMATPIMSVLVAFGLLISIALPTALLGCILIFGYFVMCIGYRSTRKTSRKLWLGKEQVSNIRELVKKLKADTEVHESTVVKVKALRERVTTELEGEALAAQLAELDQIDMELAGQRKKLDNDLLIIEGLIGHAEESHPPPSDNAEKMRTFLEKMGKKSWWRPLVTVVKSSALVVTAITLFVTVVAAPSWIPAQNVRLSSGQRLVAYQLDRTLAETSLMTVSSAMVRTYPNREISSEQICVDKGSKWLTESLVHIALGPGGQPNYPTCFDGSSTTHQRHTGADPKSKKLGQPAPQRNSVYSASSEIVNP